MIKLKPGSIIEFSSLLEDELVLATARDIAGHDTSSRSFDEVVRDSVRGLALEVSALQALEEAGHVVEPPSDHSHDAIVDGERVDIKGIFKPGSRSYSRTRWESQLSESEDTIYACFNCTSGQAVFKGWARGSSFRPSYHDASTFIFEDQLNTR